MEHLDRLEGNRETKQMTNLGKKELKGEIL